MSFAGLTKADKKALEYEVVSDNARLKLTRMIRTAVRSDESVATITWQNRVVNIARQVVSLPLYVLEADGYGDFDPAEHAWHNGELELICRRPNTAELVETLADLIEDGLLGADEVNLILEEDNVSVFFDLSDQSNTVSVYIASLEEIESTQDEHPNIRLLIDHMDRALAGADYAEVLHSSATTFETLAKLVVELTTVENQTLAGFFERYRRDSLLPPPILDFILEVYRRRNTEPLAGHGSPHPPGVTEQEAVVLVEMTKSFVRIERTLGRQAMNPLRSSPDDPKA